MLRVNINHQSLSRLGFWILLINQTNKQKARIREKKTHIVHNTMRLISQGLGGEGLPFKCEIFEESSKGSKGYLYQLRKIEG